MKGEANFYGTDAKSYSEWREDGREGQRERKGRHFEVDELDEKINKREFFYESDEKELNKRSENRMDWMNRYIDLEVDERHEIVKKEVNF